MAFRIRYRPLLSVSIRHGFHLNKGLDHFDDLEPEEKRRKLAGYDIFDDIRMHVPDDTRSTVAGLGGLVKRTPSGFVVAAEVDESASGEFVPRRLPGTGYRLRFALCARTPLFWDYTNLDLAAQRRKVYYLSNRAGEFGGTFPSLSGSPHVYDSGREYIAGDIVVGAAGEHYLAVRAGTGETPAPGSANWLSIGQRNHVTSADSALVRPMVFSYDLPPENITEASVHLIALDGTTRELVDVKAKEGEVLEKLDIDARAATPGYYALVVEAREGTEVRFERCEKVYLDPELVSLGAFAVIEIFHVPGETLGDFRLYDESAGFELLEPDFVVHFLNRHTFWRYHFSKPLADGTDLADLEPSENGENQFVTKRVMPLTRGVERVEVGKGNGEKRLLPNAPGGPIVPEPDRFYSDIYI